MPDPIPGDRMALSEDRKRLRSGFLLFQRTTQLTAYRRALSREKTIF